MVAITARQSVFDRCLTVNAETPFLAMDTGRVIGSYYNLLTNVRGAEIFYAIKANSHEAIVRALVQEGSSFDVASQPELEKVLRFGVPGQRIICSNPIKSPALLQRCAETNVFAVVADSVEEVHKIAQNAPGSRVYIRLSVDNSGAVVPLDKKFGVSGDLALELLELARELGLDPIGLSFHVGSQCINAANWVQAVRECAVIWQAAARRGLPLYFLDLGGGFPIYTDESVPTFREIGSAITSAIAEYIPETPGLRIILEPGRGLVGDNGVMVMTVVGKAQRGDKTWLYLDGGVFNGLAEILEGFTYPVCTANAEAPRTHLYTLAGPSCDSFDTIMRDVALPEVSIGDRLYLLNTGAYTTEYASNFNGFAIPTVVAF